MLRRSPCELFTRYLVLHPDGYDNQRVESTLTSLGLDFLGAYHLERIRRHFTLTNVPPNPFEPFSPTNLASQAFTTSEGVRDLFFRTSYVDEATEVLEHAKVKEYIESMIVGRVPDDTIALGLKMHLNYDISEQGVSWFKRLYWDVRGLDSVELRALLHRRYERIAESSDIEVVAQARAFKKASYADPRQLAAQLPAASSSVNYILLKMGIMPSSFDAQKPSTRSRTWAWAERWKPLPAQTQKLPSRHRSSWMLRRWQSKRRK